MSHCLKLAILLAPFVTGCAEPAAPRPAAFRFEVAVAERLSAKTPEGRLLVIIGRKNDPEPRFAVDPENVKSAIVLGRDVKAWAAGTVITVDGSADIFPYEHLAQLPKGDYVVQAVLQVNHNFSGINSPDNLYSDPKAATLDPAKNEVISIELTHESAPEDAPSETEYLKYEQIHSELLSKFRGRPVNLRAGVVLPRGFNQAKDRRYPLRVHIGGYGTRYSQVRDAMEEGSPFRKAWLADDAPRMVMLQLDGAGPYGDPYQVNSDNNGPYGDAVTREIIPYIERKYRCIGEPYARVLDGASTGGWVSLALQVFYPDFFNGAWAHAPDPVDFRSFELINIYEDANAYLNKHGVERPASRDIDGDVRTTVRHECRLERALGLGGRWELSGRDWCAWNAVFGPRGDDGLPKPLWNGATGHIDADSLDHWRKYDLRQRMEQDWVKLGPKLRGKLHIVVGEADDYFLNNAVHLLDGFLSTARPPFEGKISYGTRQNHFWRALTERGLLDEMAARVESGRKDANSRP